MCECGKGLENQAKQEILTEEAYVGICQYQKESHHIACSFPLVVLKSTDPNSPSTANKLPTDYEIKWLSKLKVLLKFLKPWLMFGFCKFLSKCKSFHFLPQILSCYSRQVVPPLPMINSSTIIFLLQGWGWGRGWGLQLQLEVALCYLL